MPDRLRAGQFQAVATSFLALFSIVGFALYGLPLYYDSWEAEFGWSRFLITSGNALSKVLVAVVFGFTAGWMIDRFGPRRLMMLGVLMAGGALVGLSTISPSAVWLFYFFYVVNALGYVCGGPPPNQVLLSRWFDKSRGKAMGIAYLGIAVGGAVVPLLSYWLTQHYGWRGALRGLGLLMVVLAFPLVYFVRESPDDREGANKSGSGGLKKTPETVSISGVLRGKSFYLLAIGSICSIGAVGGANQHLKLFLVRDSGYPQGKAAAIISLVLTFSIIGRLLMGWLADHLPKKYVMLLIYLLVACAIPLLFFASSPRAMYLFAFVFGLGLGGEYLIIPLIASQLFGVRVLGRVMGVIVTADGVAEAAFPMLLGYLRGRADSYRIGFTVLICVAVLGAVAVVSLPRGGEKLKEEVARSVSVG
jgi:MFS family permease